MKLRADLKAVVSDWFSIVLTEAQVDDILQNPDLKREIEEWGVNDTGTRDKIGSYLAKKIVGRKWPTYGDSPEYRAAFWVDMKAKCLELGYKFNGDDE